MRFAFADPPYLGCGALYKEHHDEAMVWDQPEAHRALIDRLCAEYPDGWAMCLISPSLRTILPMCPEDCRVGSWVKPFAVFKPNVNPAYAWEPVIWRGGRRGDRKRDTVRDWFAKEITLKRGLTGAKPEAFCRWVLDLLGFQDGDTIDDLFPGTAVMGRVVEGLASRGHETLPIFAELMSQPRRRAFGYAVGQSRQRGNAAPRRSHHGAEQCSRRRDQGR